MGGQDAVLVYNRQSDDATLPVLSPTGVGESVALAEQRWTCVEFHVDETAGTIDTWVDGNEVAGLVEDGTPVPDVSAHWLSRAGGWKPQLADLRLGWESYSGQSMTLWFDDVALSGQRIRVWNLSERHQSDRVPELQRCARACGREHLHRAGLEHDAAVAGHGVHDAQPQPDEPQTGLLPGREVLRLAGPVRGERRVDVDRDARVDLGEAPRRRHEEAQAGAGESVVPEPVRRANLGVDRLKGAPPGRCGPPPKAYPRRAPTVKLGLTARS